VKLKIYLIGQITKNPITYDWRKNLREMIRTCPEFTQENTELIDPCDNSFSRLMLKQTINKLISFSKNIIEKKEAKVFPAIDEGYVKYSNASIFNANHYTLTTPFVGTLFELAWYKKEPWKPVIGVFNGDPKKDYLCSHPFVWETVHTWVENPEEALSLLINLHQK
jgi:hypothetical protein